MKVIDLLNKIANGEEVPKKIKKNWIYIWTYDEIREQFTYMQETGERFDEDWLIENMLNEKVEIIEPQEHKIPEKIFLEDMYSANEIKVIDIELENKINEILDYLEMQIER